MNAINEIKEKIQAINPEISDELLELTYEYISLKLSGQFEDMLNRCKK